VLAFSAVCRTFYHVRLRFIETIEHAIALHKIARAAGRHKVARAVFPFARSWDHEIHRHQQGVLEISHSVQSAILALEPVAFENLATFTAPG
jgi:hypothetical protein